MSARARMTRRRWLVWGAVAAIAALLIVLALRPRPLEVDVGTVARGRLAVTLDEEGETRVRERYVVSAPVAGRVQRIELEPGDAVEAAETVLATFVAGDPALLDVRARGEAEARVGAARAAAERARAQLEFARGERERYERLVADGVASRERLELAERDLDTAEETLASSLAEVRAAEARALELRAPVPGGRADSIALRSPIDGVVLRRLQESEAVVAAGTPLLEVGDPAALEIVADYLSADAVAMRPGMPVEIAAWGGGETLAGRVRRVEPGGFLKVSALGVEEQRVNVIVDVVQPREAWEALGDGYRAEVRVVIWEQDDVLKAPVSALFRQSEGWAVFAVAGRRALLEQAEVGHRSATDAEILSGLEAGDVLVVYPPDDLEPGARVEPREP